MCDPVFLNYYNSSFRRSWNRSFKNSPGSCLDSWGRSWQFNQVVPSGTRVDLVFSAGCIPYGLHWGHVMDQLPSKLRSLLQKECLSTNRHGFWNPRFLYSFFPIRNQDFDLEKMGSNCNTRICVITGGCEKSADLLLSLSGAFHFYLTFKSGPKLIFFFFHLKNSLIFLEGK